MYSRGEREITVRFWSDTGHIKRRIFILYEGIQSDILDTIRFDENIDLSTIYLGKGDRSQNNKIKAEGSFSISEQGYTVGKLLDGTECQIHGIK